MYSNLQNDNATEQSPDGIEWGYSGSGPAELAARLVIAGGVSKDAEVNFSDLYYELKNKLVARIPRSTPLELVTFWSFNLFREGWVGAQLSY